MQPSAELLHLLQPALLLLRQLQASRQLQRLIGSSHKRWQQRQLQPLGLDQAPYQAGISLQSRVQQAQSAPGLQSEKGLGPWLPVKQQLQFHAQARGEGGWSRSRRIPVAPRPRPGLQRFGDLLLRFRFQNERQASRITASPNHPCGVIGHAGWVQEGQFTARKMTLATVRVQEPWLPIT